MESLSQFFSFDGRIRRITIWINGVVNVVIYLILLAISASSNSTGVALVAFLGFIVLSIRVLSLSVRRWHDLDKSGWMVLISLVPIVGLYAVFMLGFKSGDLGPNQYGAAPEEGQLF